MAGVQGSALAIAVANAGGLGSLPCAMLDLDGIGRELRAISTHPAYPVNVDPCCYADAVARGLRKFSVVGSR